MDNIRFILFTLFCMLAWMLWDAWQLDYGPKPDLSAQTEGSLPEVSVVDKSFQDLPQTVSNGISEDAKNIEDAPFTTESVLPKGERIQVTTDVLKLEIDTLGGGIRILDLLDYPISEDNLNESIRLFDDSGSNLYISQNGILSSASNAPNHNSLFTANSYQYQLDPDEDTLVVPLWWTNDEGISATKTYIFHRRSYVIDIEQTIDNRSDKVWNGRQYFQLQRKLAEDKDSSMFIRTYTGGVIYNDEDKYEKIGFDDMMDEVLSVDAKGGWSAIIQHYFLAALIPPAEETNHFYTKTLSDQRFVIGSYSEQFTVPQGDKKTVRAQMFVGPKIQHEMEALSPGLELTVDYGFLTIIGKPIYWLLNKYHSVVDNWGFAIIMVTFTIKAIFFKLSEASYRSMAKMRKLQPRMQALRDRYGEDKQRMNMEIMQLYKQEKVNPLGGCLPILVQIPVFIALYWVLIESVELRQAPFIGYITDLSIRDPYFILPLLMGLSMFLQQRLNPTPVDPVQEKILKLFPLIFTVFFLFFPAGLVLYWVINNSLSIIQQTYITKQIEKGSAKA